MTSRIRKPSVNLKTNVKAFPYPAVSETTEDTPITSPGGSESQSARISPSTSTYSMTSGATSPIAEDEDAIKVIVRMRPMNSIEKQRTDGQAIFVLEDGQTIQIQKVIDGKPVKPQTFHRAFDDSSTQEGMFEQSGVKSLVEKAVEGYNVTVFAYGQTGSGKTHTITGPEDVRFTIDDINRWGIVPRALKQIYTCLSQMDSSVRTTVYASYLEIYNEQVQDLLNPTNASLPIRLSTEKGFYVENLFVVECEVLDDCLAVMEEGLRNRKVASHSLNEHSSRSHGLMAITIESEVTDPEDGRIIRKKGKMTFVDLAGSEKLKESKATGDTLTETLNINKSLLTLGNCISALADMRKKRNGTTHIPYRDSKLTRLLSDSIGGNGLALMIACVSPSGHNINETLNTLRYASRAKRIHNRPVIQMDPREELIMRLKEEVKKLQTDNDSLRQTIMELSMGNGDVLKKTDGAKGSITRTNSKVDEASGALVSKLMEENKQIQHKNKELELANQKVIQDKNELLKENERLILKMERFAEIFSVPDEDKNAKKNGSKRDSIQGKPQNAPSDMAKKDIDRSNNDLAETAAKSSSLPKPKNNDALRKELKDLDKQISSLAKETKGVNLHK